MDSTRAFELRESFDPKLFGGSVTLQDGSSYDVAAALTEGDGKIVTDDEHLILALDAYPPLKTGSVPEKSSGKSAPKTEGKR